MSNVLIYGMSAGRSERWQALVDAARMDGLCLPASRAQGGHVDSKGAPMLRNHSSSRGLNLLRLLCDWTDDLEGTERSSFRVRFGVKGIIVDGEARIILPPNDTVM